MPLLLDGISKSKSDSRVAERAKMKKLVVLLSVFLVIPLLTACWDYREVNEMSIVVGFSVDKGSTSKFLVTYEIVDMQEAGKEGKVKSVLLESEGDTMLEAARNAISKNFPKLYFGHAVAVAISKEIAQEGVIDVLDFITRDAETRLSIHLFVSEEETAGKLLRVKPVAEELLAIEINNILKEQRYLAKAIPVQTYEFVNSIIEEGVSCVMTSACIVSNGEDEVINICGSAVFKNDKLLGFIDGEETKVLSFILDRIEGGVIVVKIGSGNNESRFSLEIKKSSTKLKPVIKDNKLSIEIEIDTRVALDEHISEQNYNTKKGQEELCRVAEEQLKGDIEKLIKKMKTEFSSDIFGFGNSIYKKHPKLWKEIRENWEQEFKEIEVTIKPQVKIMNTVLLEKPIEIGEY